MLTAGLLALGMLFLSGCQSTGTSSEPTKTAEQNSIICQTAAQGGNLYYQNMVLAIDGRIVFNSSAGQLCLADPDGQFSQPLLKETVSFPAYDGSRLFYTGTSTEGALEKIALDGTNQVRIGQTALKYLICDENWLYAIERTSGRAIRLKKDGANRTVLVDQMSIALTLSEDKLYITGAEKPYGLTCIDLASGDTESIFSDTISSLNVSGKWLYYSQPSDSYALCAWSADEPGGTICRLSFDKPFVVSENFLYFIHSADLNRLCRLPLNGGESLDGLEPECVVDDLVDAFVVLGDYIYYRRPSSSRIYRVSRLDRSIVRIT